MQQPAWHMKIEEDRRSEEVAAPRWWPAAQCDCTVRGAGRARRSNGDAWHRRGKRGGGGGGGDADGKQLARPRHACHTARYSGGTSGRARGGPRTGAVMPDAAREVDRQDEQGSQTDSRTGHAKVSSGLVRFS